jgi:diguanylate cyclase (GGDEF)-like protein
MAVWCHGRPGPIGMTTHSPMQPVNTAGQQDISADNHSLRHAITGSGARRLIAVAGLAISYLLLGLASFGTHVSHGIVTPVCFMPEGVALAAALLFGPRLWPGVFLGQLLLASSQALPLPVGLAIAAINSLEMVCAALLFRRWRLHADLQRLQDLTGLLLLIVLVLQPFSATLGTAALWLGGLIHGARPLVLAWVDWWVGNVMGQVLLTPLLLCLIQQRRRKATLNLRCSVLVLLVIPAIWLAFELLGSQGTSMLLVVFTPILVMLAIGPGLGGVSAASLAMTISALTLTSAGQGPFVSAGQPRILDLNLFVLGLAVTAQFLAVLLHERRTMEEQLRQLAFYDPLTRLPNRRQIDDRLLSLTSSRHQGQFHGVIFLDLDGFKQINDTHGHDAGDRLLVLMAERLRESVRRDDLVGRLGGDEFVVLLEELGPEPRAARERARLVAGSLRHRLSAPYGLGAEEVHCQASVGVTVFAADTADSREILHQADMAMYAAKRAQQTAS